MNVKTLTTLLILTTIHIAYAGEPAADAPLDGLTEEQIVNEANRLRVEPPQAFQDEANNPLLSRELTAQEIDELLPYATNAKLEIEDLEIRTAPISPRSVRVEELRSGLEQIVSDSGTKRNLLQMKFALTRTLEVARLLEEDQRVRPSKITNHQITLLKSGIALGKKYFTADTNYLREIQQALALEAKAAEQEETSTDSEPAKPAAKPGVLRINHAALGLDTTYLLWSTASRFSSYKVQYKIYRLAMATLLWDLHRDADLRKAYAPAIVRIHRVLKRIPEDVPNNTGVLKAKVAMMQQNFVYPWEMAIKAHGDLFPDVQINSVEKNKDQKSKQLKESKREEKSGAKYKFPVYSDSEIGLRIGDQVVYDSSIREVGILDNKDRVVLKENDASYQTFTKRSEVEKIFACSESYCENDVVFFGNSIRILEGVYDKNRVILKENNDSYRSYSSERRISGTTRCNGDFCVGDRVLLEDSVRTIELLDWNNRVLLKEDNISYQTFTTTNKISKVIK